MRSRSTSVSTSTRRPRIGLSLDRNNNAPVDKQPRMVHTSSKHVNEGFFGVCSWMQPVESRQDVEELYDIGSVIGKGNFSAVHVVVRKSDRVKCAMKQVEKKALRGKCFFVENEVEVLSLINHPNIISICDAFASETKYFLVFEHAQYGDLYEMVRKCKTMAEPDAAKIVLQASSALAYLHERNVVHRDVKPENLLLTERFHVKLCDFGLACHVLGPLKRICGTPTYCAPEILKENGYGVKVDVWSLGIVLHVMLVGFAPFRANDQPRLFRLIMQSNINLEMPDWRNVSLKAKNLLQQMMCPNEERRPSAAQIQRHPWIVPFTFDSIDDE